MKVIALKGEKDSGKSTTLKEVYKILKAAGGEPERYCFKDLKGNSKDLRDVINFAGKKIGIVTQGDYPKGEYSVVNHLAKLKDYDCNCGCDIAICACTTGKNIEETIINYYPEATFIHKTKNENVSLRQIENTLKAMEIIQILKLWLLNATK